MDAGRTGNGLDFADFWARMLEGGEDGEVRQFVRDMISRSATDAVPWVLAQRDLPHWERLMTLFAAELALTAPEHVPNLIGGLENADLRGKAAIGALRSLVDRNPSELAPMIDRMPYGDYLHNSAFDAVVRLSRTGYGACLDVIERLSDPEVRGKVASSLADLLSVDLSRASETEKGGILKLATDDASRQRLLAAWAAQQALDWVAAGEWSRRPVIPLAADNLSSRFEDEVWTSVGRHVPADSLDAALATAGSPEREARVLGGFAAVESQKAPAKAAERLGKYATRADAEVVMIPLMASWLAVDPAKASAWVPSLPPSPGRDAAARAVALYSWRQGDHEAALKWTESVQDARVREELMKLTGSK